MFSRQALTRYIESTAWFLSDSMGQRRGKLSLIVFVSILGLLFQITAISQSLYYANLIASGKPLIFMGNEYFPRTSLELLCIAAGCIFTTIALAAILTYSANRMALALSMDYERLCFLRGMATLGAMHPAGDKAFLNTQDPHNRIVKSDPRLAGRAFLKVIHSIVPLGTLAVATACLLYLDLHTTLALLPVGVIGAYAIAKGNIRSAQSYSQYEISMVPALRDKTALLGALFGTDIARKPVIKETNSSLTSGPIYQQLESYTRFMKAIDWNNCLNTIILGTGFLLVFLMLGRDIISDQTGWERLVIYLVGLRYLTESLRQVTSNLLTVNRFMPQIQRLRSLFCRDAHEDERSEEVSSFDLKTDELHGDATERTIGAPNKTAILSPYSLDALSVEWFYASQVAAQPSEIAGLHSNTTFMAQTYTPLPGMSIRQAFGLDSSFTFDDLTRLCDLFEFKENINDRLAYLELEGFDSPLTASQWKKTDRLVFSLMGIIGMHQTGKRIVILDSKLLRSLPRQGKTIIEKLFSNELVLVNYGPDAKDHLLIEESTVILCGANGTVAQGSSTWFNKTKASLIQRQRELQESLHEDTPFPSPAKGGRYEIELDEM